MASQADRGHLEVGSKGEVGVGAGAALEVAAVVAQVLGRHVAMAAAAVEEGEA